MSRIHHAFLLCALAAGASAQTQHLDFDRPEAWALKYFTSSTLMNGLQPPEPLFERRGAGSITVGLEMGWLPRLNADRARVGFTGRKEEDVNKIPGIARPVIRVGLPWRFSVIAAPTLPVEVSGVRPRLFALGVERPIFERDQWNLGWRVYGQTGSVKAAFTCPSKALAYPARSPQNPSGCVAESDDSAYLRYAGAELHFAHRIPGAPRLTPHIAGAINYINSAFQVNAPLQNDRVDHSRLATHGKTFSGSAGVSYMLTERFGLTVDAFYTPLSVRRVSGGPRTNDGLFNLRALLSYALR
jgi:hypothetical protein